MNSLQYVNISSLQNEEMDQKKNQWAGRPVICMGLFL